MRRVLLKETLGYRLADELVRRGYEVELVDTHDELRKVLDADRTGFGLIMMDHDETEAENLAALKHIRSSERYDKVHVVVHCHCNSELFALNLQDAGGLWLDSFASMFYKMEFVETWCGRAPHFARTGR
jgi:hypothetical protein